MLPAEDLFVHCYVLVDDLIKSELVVIPPRPGPARRRVSGGARVHVVRVAGRAGV